MRKTERILAETPAAVVMAVAVRGVAVAVAANGGGGVKTKRAVISWHVTILSLCSAAKESGAILPELGELQVVSARLARPAGVANNTANGDGDLYLDLEQWALCYPGDASEVLRWSCAMAGMHMAVF